MNQSKNAYALDLDKYRIPSISIKPQMIFFVHGWRYEGEFRRQPCNFGRLPQLLSKTFECSTIPFAYPTGITNNSMSFYEPSKRLRNLILKCVFKARRNFRDANGGDTLGTYKNVIKIAVIGHCAGGIVARKAITERMGVLEIDSCIKKMILIASPATGGGSVALLSILAKFPWISPEVQELNGWSDFLLQLNSKWFLWTNQWVQQEATCCVRCFYGSEDVIVAPADAAILDPFSVCIDGYDHNSVKDVDSENHPTFIQTVACLDRAGFVRKQQCLI